MGLVNIQNTNLENGVTNRNAADLFGSMGQLDPTKYNNFFDDFSTPAANALTLAGYEDIATGSVAAGGSQVSSIILTTGASAGNAAITATASKGFDAQANQNTGPQYFRTRVLLGDVTDSIFIGGLADAITGITPDDGAFFQISDTADTVDFVVRSGAAEVVSAAAIATAVDDEWITLEYYFDGIDRYYYGVNGTPLGFVEASTLPADELAPTVGVISGAGAGAKDCEVDYLFCAQLRG